MLSPLEIETSDLLKLLDNHTQINLCYLHWRLKRECTNINEKINS